MHTLNKTTYAQLVRIARRRHPDLDEPAELVHAAWTKLSRSQFHARDADHMKAATLCAMRQVAADMARARSSQKRGGTWTQVEHTPIAPPPPTCGNDLRKALARLTELDHCAAQVVVLKGRDGLTTDECAARLGRSRRSVAQKWSEGRTFLQRALAA